MQSRQFPRLAQVLSLLALLAVMAALSACGSSTTSTVNSGASGATGPSTASTSSSTTAGGNSGFEDAVRGTLPSNSAAEQDCVIEALSKKLSPDEIQAVAANPDNPQKWPAGVLTQMSILLESGTGQCLDQ
jgi:hypothetical protein